MKAHILQHVPFEVVAGANGYIVFDDTVADKNYSYKIETVRRQYSGNAHDVIKGSV